MMRKITIKKPKILTICPNMALDKVYFIDKWSPGSAIRTQNAITCVGGKGLDAAVVLIQLGLETIAIGYFAGHVGQELIRLLDDYGIYSIPVWTDGTTRTAHVIAEEETNIHTHIIVGEIIVNNAQKQAFVTKFSEHIEVADWVILGGSLPPSADKDFYAELISLAKEQNVPCLIDSQKEYLTRALATNPAIVKMNWEEFDLSFDNFSPTIKLLYENANIIRIKYNIENMVITLSADGIIALTTEGDFHCKAPLQVPVNAAGAGDAVSSALVWQLSLGKTWKEALRWAGAVGAAAVLTKRTGDILMEDILRILPSVDVKEI